MPGRGRAVAPGPGKGPRNSTKALEDSAASTFVQDPEALGESHAPVRVDIHSRRFQSRRLTRQLHPRRLELLAVPASPTTSPREWVAGGKRHGKWNPHIPLKNSTRNALSELLTKRRNSSSDRISRFSFVAPVNPITSTTTTQNVRIMSCQERLRTLRMRDVLPIPIGIDIVRSARARSTGLRCGAAGFRNMTAP